MRLKKKGPHKLIFFCFFLSARVTCMRSAETCWRVLGCIPWRASSLCGSCARNHRFIVRRSLCLSHCRHLPLYLSLPTYIHVSYIYINIYIYPYIYIHVCIYIYIYISTLRGRGGCWTAFSGVRRPCAGPAPGNTAPTSISGFTFTLNLP